jgi:RES domain-containing protein
VYLSEHRSLAALEVLVHVPRVQILRDRYAMIPVEIPDELVEDLDAATLPSGWNDPVDLGSTQRIGDRWLEERASAALRVPSAVIRGERNLLLAPDHPDAGRIDIAGPEAFLFDARLAR